MRVYLVRHAQAEKGSPSGLDFDRPLTVHGQMQALGLARLLADEPVERRPALIISSPAARAIATARALHAALKCDLEEDATLIPDASAASVLALVEQTLAQGISFAVVGHNPTLEEVGAALRSPGQRSGMSLSTGEAFVFDVSGATKTFSGTMRASL